MKRTPKIAAPKFGGDQKKYTLDYFDHLQSVEQETKEIELLKKKREISERAKKRF